MEDDKMRTGKPVRQILAAATLAAGLNVAAGAAAAQEYELLEPGVVKCAFTGSFAPFAMQDPDGTWKGLTVEVFREAIERLDLELEYVITKWESLLVGLFADQYDILCDTMDITKERQDRVLFVDGWLESGGRLVVHEDSDVQELGDFKGKVMGVLIGSTWAELAKELEPGEIKYYQAESDVIQDVADKKVEGMVTDSIAAAYAAENAGMPLRTIPGYLSRIQKGWAVKKDHVNLVKAINGALDEMVADGTYERLTADIIGYSPYPEQPIRSQIE
jgi:polar amino acid transport system substrate-binding protein